MNKFVLRFSGDSTEYAGVFGPDCLPDNHNYIKILDATRKYVVRMFMTNEQYDALPAEFKDNGPSNSAPISDAVCAVQITTNSLDLDDPTAGFAERTIQTSYCFVLESAHVVLSGVDTDIREIRLASTNYNTFHSSYHNASYNTRKRTKGSILTVAEALAQASSRQDILDAVAPFGPAIPDEPSGDVTTLLPPVNFVSKNQKTYKVVRRLLDPFARALVFNPWASELRTQAAGDWSVVLIQSDDAIVDKIDAAVAYCRSNGATTGTISETWGNVFSPAKSVYFTTKLRMKSVEGDAVSEEDITSQYTYGWHAPITQNEYTASYVADDWTNPNFVYCTQLTNCRLRRGSIKPRCWQLLGAYPICHSNAIRKVEIIYSKHGVITLVYQHNGLTPELEDEKGIEQEDFNIISSRGMSIERRCDGTLDVINDVNDGKLFLVKLNRTATGASYDTYDVYDVFHDSQIIVSGLKLYPFFGDTSPFTEYQYAMATYLRNDPVGFLVDEFSRLVIVYPIASDDAYNISQGVIES